MRKDLHRTAGTGTSIPSKVYSHKIESTDVVNTLQFPSIATITMKFSTGSLLLLTPLAVATGATAAIPEPSVDLEGRDDGSWRDIFSRLRIGFRGMKKRPTAQDLAFLAHAIKRSYNVIHAPLDDDYNFVDFNISAVEMQVDVSMESTSFLDAVFDDLEWLTAGSDLIADVDRKRKRSSKRKWTVSTYGISDISCRLCGKDRNAIALSSGALTGPAPLTNLKPIEDLLCTTLKNEGPKEVYGDVDGCKIFQIESLGSWDFEDESTSNEQDTTAKTHGTAPGNEDTTGDASLSIALTGLSCDESHDFASCQDDGLLQIVSDALVIAYNKVNFGDDYFIEDFVPASLELYHDEVVVPVPSMILRGSRAPESRPTGTWRGSVRVQCRTCANNGETEEGLDPALAPFFNLEKVERAFCKLISAAGYQSAALAALGECSLSVAQMVEQDEIAPLMLLIDNE